MLVRTKVVNAVQRLGASHLCGTSSLHVPHPKATIVGYPNELDSKFMAHQKAAKRGTESVIQSSADGLDPNSLAKWNAPPTPLHLNVRVTGDDVTIFEHLRNRTANITDSLRVRDSVRTAVFLLAMREKGAPVMVKDANGKDVEVLEHLGVFYPELPSKSRATRKR